MREENTDRDFVGELRRLRDDFKKEWEKRRKKAWDDVDEAFEALRKYVEELREHRE